MKRRVVAVLIILIIAGAAVLASDIGYIRKTDAEAGVTAVTAEPSAEPAAEPEPEQPRVIYLTFDDGPYKYTEKLLDICSQYGVKVTFFVTDQNPEYDDLITREYEDGHAVGIHTACHRYSEIYSSEEAYLKDFEKMDGIVFEKTGQHPKIMRFPGGSDNTVSKKYSTGIMTRLAETMTEKGYVYFDWYIDSFDTGGLTTPEAVAESVKNQIPDCPYDLIILLHDVNWYTVDSVEEIIRWGLENGYVFDKLSEDVTPVHAKISN